MTNWPARFIALANHIATWSKDPSTKVGAVIVDNQNRVVSMGYNGVPRGVSEAAPTNRTVRLLRTIHAEENALHFAEVDVTGHTMYINRPPCARCAAHIIQRGITRVIYAFDDYGNPEFLDRWKNDFAEARLMFAEAGVEVQKI
jgi:dCMP deaminase